MNKKVYEAPDMVKRMVTTQSIAALTSGDDNELDIGDTGWE